MFNYSFSCQNSHRTTEKKSNRIVVNEILKKVIRISDRLPPVTST